ncbi:MFS transporter [Phenylobacterium immobile]|uniref:MFS transporter n=1 Tax=Phenylobacterium immobile TaxID=21 RepID=UPI000B2EF217|nr:MFS transporter [Phenylobacterium immobile]
MISDLLAQRLARRNIHYAWVVAAATFVVMLLTAGAVGTPGVFMTPLQKQFGWKPADVSAALALRFAIYGLTAPFAAVLMNRFGLRRVVVIALTVIVAALGLSLMMREVWHLMLLWGLLVGLGTGMMAVVLGATVATRWFAKRRGLVVGLLAASFSTGQLVFLPLLAAMTERYGWKTSILFICGMLGTGGVVAALFMRDRPADLGLPAFGDDQVAPAPAQAGGFAALAAAPIKALAAVRASRTFWLLFATFFVCGLSTNGLIQSHFIAFCGDYGVVPVAAAGVLALMGVFDFFGTTASGWLSDRYDSRWLLFWYYGLRGVSLLLLPFSGFNVMGLSLFAVFYGLDWIATVPPTVKLATERFGPERANVVFGWIFAGHQLGAAAAAFGAGLSRTMLLTYLPAFFAAGAMCLAAAALILTLKRPQPAVAA